MPEERMVHKAVKLLYTHRAEGDLLMDAPATESWEELKELAKEDDKWAWQRRVRAIKDTVHIQATKGKGEKKRKRSNKKKKKTAKKKKKTKKGRAQRRRRAPQQEVRRVRRRVKIVARIRGLRKGCTRHCANASCAGTASA